MTRLPESAARSPAASPLNPPKTTEWIDAQPRAGEHRDRQLRNHRHVNRDAVAGLQPAEVAQHRRDLVHPRVQLLVGDRAERLVLRFGHEDERRLVLVLRQMPVDAVVAGVELPADEPFPERRLARVERRMPVPIPGQQVGVFPEALRKMLLREPFDDGGIDQIRLADELWRGKDVLLFLPMDGNLRLVLLRGSPFNGHDPGLLCVNVEHADLRPSRSAILFKMCARLKGQTFHGGRNAPPAPAFHGQPLAGGLKVRTTLATRLLVQINREKGEPRPDLSGELTMGDRAELHKRPVVRHGGCDITRLVGHHGEIVVRSGMTRVDRERAQQKIARFSRPAGRLLNEREVYKRLDVAGSTVNATRNSAAACSSRPARRCATPRLL